MLLFTNRAHKWKMGNLSNIARTIDAADGKQSFVKVV